MAETPQKPEEKAPEKDKKTSLLNLMRFWLFGTFIIVWAATFAYIGMFTNKNVWATLAAGWPIWLITLVLCVIAYFGYTVYVNKKYG
nr:hypothetical protein [Anaerolineae bacterium]